MILALNSDADRTRQSPVRIRCNGIQNRDVGWSVRSDGGERSVGHRSGPVPGASGSSG